VDRATWLQMPEHSRRAVVESLRADLQECSRRLEAASGSDDVLKLVGEFAYLRKKLTQLERLEKEEGKPMQDTRSKGLGY
jgi:hypothetical protein